MSQREYVFSDKVSSLKPSAIREILKATSQPGMIAFAAGNPAPDAFPSEELAAISAKIFAERPIDALQYSITEGYNPLRTHIRERYPHLFSQGDEIIITSGAQQVMNLSTQSLCNEGDVIICENPSFIGSLNAFRSFGVNLVGVDVENDGMNIEQLENALKENPTARFIYVIPNFQNPSGITTSLEKRKAILELAKKYGVLILEDNPYGETRFAGEEVPTIKSLDTDGVVIYAGSFSKVISPGLRVGYAIAPAAVIAKMTVCKQVSDVHTTIYSQMLVDEYLCSGKYDEHIENIRAIYGRKCALMCDMLDKHLAPTVSYVRPEGGLFIWCKLPAEVDMLTLCSRAVERKVAFVPGSAFLPDTSGSTNDFRVNYSTPSDEQIVTGCEILGEILRDMLAGK